MVYGARNWGTRSFGDGSNASDLAVPPPASVQLYGPGSFGSSSIGVAAYGGPAINTPGVIPPVVYTVSLVGALSISGALGPKSQLAIVAAMTSSGAKALIVRKSFAGGISLAGTLTMRASDIRINGQITPTGVVRKLTARSWSSTATPAGALRKTVVSLPFDAALEMTGALDAHKQNQAPSLAAAISPTAALVRRTLKGFVASLFPHGSLSMGIQSPGGYAGTIRPMGALMLVYPGGLTSLAQLNMSGQLHLTVARSFAGSMASSSTTQKVSGHHFTGTITPASALVGSGRRSVTVSGSLTPAGAYRPAPQKRMAGTITGTSALERLSDFHLAGTLTSSGTRTLQGPGVGAASFLAVESLLRPTGRVTHKVLKNLAGTITPASTTVAIYYEPMVLVPGFVYTKYRRGVLLP